MKGYLWMWLLLAIGISLLALQFDMGLEMAQEKGYHNCSWVPYPTISSWACYNIYQE